jgi:hypothetical protein
MILMMMWIGGSERWKVGHGNVDTLVEVICQSEISCSLGNWSGRRKSSSKFNVFEVERFNIEGEFSKIRVKFQIFAKILQKS